MNKKRRGWNMRYRNPRGVAPAWVELRDRIMSGQLLQDEIQAEFDADPDFEFWLTRNGGKTR